MDDMDYYPVPISYALSRFTEKCKLHMPAPNYPTFVKNHKDRQGFIGFKKMDFMRRYFGDTLRFIDKDGRKTFCKNRFDTLDPSSVIDQLTPEQLFPFVKISPTGPVKLTPAANLLRLGAELYPGYGITKATENLTSFVQDVPVSPSEQISCDNQSAIDKKENRRRRKSLGHSDGTLLPSLDSEKAPKKIKVETVSPENKSHTKASSQPMITPARPPQEILSQCQVTLEQIIPSTQSENLESFQHSTNSKPRHRRTNTPTMDSCVPDHSSSNSDSESAKEEISENLAHTNKSGSDDEPTFSRKRAKFSKGGNRTKRHVRMNYVKTYMSHLHFVPASLETAIAKVTKSLGWDVFPFGADIIGRTVNKKEMESVAKKEDSTEWDLLKEAFVLKHFSEAFKIRKNTKGKWICCKNSIDFVDCKAYLKLFWNIKTI